jgi:hypothetical protein
MNANENPTNPVSLGELERALGAGRTKGSQLQNL